MCGCNKGRIPVRPATRTIAGRVATRANPVAVVYVPTPTPVYVPNPVRQRNISQSRFPQRNRFQPAPAPPLYNPDTAVWGPSLWRILHTLAECSDNSPLWVDIVNAMEIYIPCPTCKTHFTEYKRNNPITISNQGIVDWFFIFHNVVNARLGKPLFDAAGLPKGVKATLLSDLAPIITGLSVSFPPDFIALLQRMVASL